MQSIVDRYPRLRLLPHIIIGRRRLAAADAVAVLRLPEVHRVGCPGAVVPQECLIGRATMINKKRRNQLLRAVSIQHNVETCLRERQAEMVIRQEWCCGC